MHHSGQFVVWCNLEDLVYVLQGGSRKATFIAINTVVWLMGFSTIMLAVNRKEGKNSSLFAAMMITWYLFFCVITFKLWE